MLVFVEFVTYGIGGCGRAKGRASPTLWIRTAFESQSLSSVGRTGPYNFVSS